MPSTLFFAGHEVSNNTHPQWWKDPGLRRLTFHLLAIIFGTFSIGYDGVTINGFFAIDQFIKDMKNPNSSQQGLITTGLFIGETVIAIPAQMAADKWGRRRPTQVGAIITITGVLVQVFAIKGWAVFFVSRLLIGLGNGIPMIIGSVHLMELAHPRLSSKMGAWFGGGYFLGAISAAWITFGCLWINSNWSWRLPSFFQVIPALYQLIMINFTPESPRWLIANGREEEAFEVLTKYHANGDQYDELVRLEITEIKASLELEKHHFGYLDFLRTPGNRKRLGIACFIGAMQNWAGNGIISYYLVPILRSVGIASAVQQQAINGSLQIFSFLVAIIAIQYSQVLGRRTLWLTSFIGCFISYALLTLCSALYAQKGSIAAGSASIAWIFTFNGSYVSGLTILAYSYVAELMPFHARNKASALHLMVCTSAGVINQYMNPVAFTAIGWKYYPVYLAVLAVSIAVVYFVFPETAHLTLEESAHVLDGKAVQEKLVHATVVTPTESIEEKDSELSEENRV